MLAHRDDFFDEAAGSPHSRSKKAERRRARREMHATQRKEDTRYKQAQPQNETQQDYLDAMADSDQVFAVGEPGGGKTYLAANYGMGLLMQGIVDVIIIARPTASKKKHQQGFQPGKSDEKIAPWMVPVMEGLRAASSPALVDRYKRENKIVFVPFEFMQGRTFHKAFVILDEAQNCDLGDLRNFLTRMGEGSRVVVCGDPSKYQTVIPDSGLKKVLWMIDQYDIPAEIIRFRPEDVVRSAIAKEWVQAFCDMEPAEQED